MAESAPTVAAAAAAAASAPATGGEKTFRAYTAEQGEQYAQNRQGYHPNLFKYVVDNHASTGGQLDVVLDIGCGPGFAARGLAPSFQRAIGLDPSAGMISAAEGLGGASANGEPIRFAVSSAEQLGADIDPPIADGSVDLITAATAAHWFDMPAFWRAADRVLRPGGTVSLWTGTGPRLVPTTPNALAIQTAFEELRQNMLMPFHEKGNLMAMKAYADLLLPWTMPEPVTSFDQEAFVRKDWPTIKQNEDGTIEVDDSLMGRTALNMDKLEAVMATMSPVTRWREANPDLVGTDGDIVKVLRARVVKLLHEAGVEPGKEVIESDRAGVMLTFKKKQA